VKRLDEINARAADVASAMGNGDSMGPTFQERAFRLAEEDVPRLVAAVEAALSIADTPNVITHHPKGDKTFYVEAHRIHAAITAALKAGRT